MTTDHRLQLRPGGERTGSVITTALAIMSAVVLVAGALARIWAMEPQSGSAHLVGAPDITVQREAIVRPAVFEPRSNPRQVTPSAWNDTGIDFVHAVNR